MQVLLAVFVAGATKSSSDLKTSAADLAAATTELEVGGGSTSGWGSFKVEDLTASTGTKIVFKWGMGHNVVMTNKAAFDGCTLGDEDSKCLATDAGSANGDCAGVTALTKGTDNKYTYEAVMANAGEYYFICGVSGHCDSQKVKVTVVPPGDLASPPPGAPAAMSTASPPPASASPPPAESSEDSAAASLGSGALGTALLVTATTALLRGFRF